jgi:hypothetical protein
MLVAPSVTLMPFNEILNGGWHIAPLEIAASTQLVSHVFRNVLRPALIEGDDVDRIFYCPRRS